MNGRKWKNLGLIVVAIFIIGGVLIYNRLSENLELLVNEPVRSVDFSKMDDGNYEGEYNSFPVTVKLNVEIRDHRVMNINILEHQNGKGSPAEIITDEIIEEQSLDVDIVSGATYSSKVILKAVEDALTKK